MQPKTRRPEHVDARCGPVDEVRNLQRKGWETRFTWAQISPILLKIGSVRETAEVLGVSPMRLYKWLSKKKRKKQWKALRARLSRERRRQRDKVRAGEKARLDRAWFSSEVQNESEKLQALLLRGDVEGAVAHLERDLDLPDDLDALDDALDDDLDDLDGDLDGTLKRNF